MQTTSEGKQKRIPQWQTVWEKSTENSDLHQRDKPYLRPLIFLIGVPPWELLSQTSIAALTDIMLIQLKNSIDPEEAIVRLQALFLRPI